LNNIFINQHPFRGAIVVADDALDGFVSDYNLLISRLSPDGDATILDLAAWQELGYDAHSMVAADPLSTLFVDIPAARLPSRISDEPTGGCRYHGRSPGGLGSIFHSLRVRSALASTSAVTSVGSTRGWSHSSWHQACPRPTSIRVCWSSRLLHPVL
jgi:hypothetical protein